MPSQYDDPAVLKGKKLCLNAVSKNLEEGLLTRLSNTKDCTAPKCKTIKLVHSLKVLVRTNQPCDSKPSVPFDGTLEVQALLTEEIDVPAGRGIHAGNFVWTSTNGSTVIAGAMTGFINIGPHRKPFTTGAVGCDQQCNPRLVLEGRLCGKFKKSPHDTLKDCEVLADYRLRLSVSELEPQAKVNGTLEGVLVCPCG